MPRLRSTILAFISFLFLTSCVVSLSPQEMPSRESEVPSTTSSTSAPSSPLESGEEYLKKGDYKEAIKEFIAVLRNDPSNRSAKRGLELAQKGHRDERERIIRSLIDLKESGFDFYHRQEYVRAGQTWMEAINLYDRQDDPGIQRDLPFMIDEVSAQLDLLLHVLIDKGVLLYRRGELQAAIFAWQDVLLINPQQQEAIDYIHKARTKIETLEHLLSPTNLP